MPELPGWPVTDDELRTLEFSPLDLDFQCLDVALPQGIGCEWKTSSWVPDSPGLYAFAVSNDSNQCVAYVGQTSHLWMVTKGRLPSGLSRPGQRYGRPKYAGDTRQRINVLIRAEVAQGYCVRHWVRTMSQDQLLIEEEALIRRWRLRECGWNRR